MILTQVAACASNRVMGANGGLPWNLPEDMKFFKDTTKGHIMIMGRKTFDSFNGRALPNRYHIVITRNPKEHSFPSTEKSPVVFVKSLDEAVAHAQPLTAAWGEEVFIIGGGEIYRQSLGISDRVLLTLIHQPFPGDTYFPEIKESEFSLTAQKDVGGEIPFSFLTYERK